MFLDQRVEGLRRVLIPRDLTYRFLLLADSNTGRGIETCGVLCGKLVRPQLEHTSSLWVEIYFVHEFADFSWSECKYGLGSVKG